MTLHDVAHQLFTICKPIPCYINQEKRKSEAEVRDLLKHWLCKEQDRYICELAMPDGRWHVLLTRDGSYYDYYLPETREQEQKLLAHFA